MKTVARTFRCFVVTVAFIAGIFSYAEANTQAAPLILGTAITDALTQTSQTKYYSFTLDFPALVSLRLTHASNGSDYTYLKATIKSSDAATNYLPLESAGNATDLTREVALPAGSYLVQVEPGWAGGGYSSFGLTVSATTGGTYEAEKNDYPETATNISTETTITGVLTSQFDVDYYRFNLYVPSFVTLNFTHPEIATDQTGLDPIFWNATIRSSDNNQEYLHLLSGAATSTNRTVALRAGSYLMRVGRGWYGTNPATYTFKIGIEPRNYLETEKNETPETATPMKIDTSYAGIITPLQNNDVDYYSFTAPTSQPLLVNFNHADTGVADRVWKVEVLDGQGEQYLSFDSAGTAAKTSRGTLPLSAGATYYVKVTSYSVPYSLNNRYELSVTPDIEPPYSFSSPPGGIFDHSVVVTLNCNDGTQSGCDKIYYTTDGSTPTTSSAVYSSPIAIPDNVRRVQLKHFAVDLAGNSGMITTQIFDVDTIDPVTTISPAGNAFQAATTVTLSCSDIGVGCDTIFYTTDGSYPGSSSTMAYREPIQITETTNLQFSAIDRAGNGEEVQSRLIHIDATPPKSAAPAGGVVTSDTVAWTARNPQDSHYVQNGVIAVNDTLFTIGGRINAFQSDISSGYILAGSDGGTWTESFNDFVPYCYNSATWGRACNSSLYGVTGTGTPFAVVGAMGHIRTANTAALYEYSGTEQELYAVTWAGYLSKYIVVGAQGTITTSADGATWTVQPAVTGQDLRGVASSDDRLVAVGSGGTILTSSDGAAWSAVPSGTTEDLRGVTWSPDGGMYVAVGANGTLLTSEDGLLWQPQNSRVFDTLNAVTASENQFVAVGNYGTVVASLDGELWTEQPSGTTEHLNAVTWSGTKFFAVGVAGSWITGVEKDPEAATIKKITLSCSDGQGSGCDKIYYSTDGSTPSSASTVYSGAFDISGTTTLKFFAVDKAGNAEQPKAEVYAFGPTTPPPAPGDYSLSVTLAGSGTGSVNSVPSGFTCVSGTCTRSYAQGIIVSLLPAPSGDSVFAGWSGACSGTGNCSVTMSGDRSVTATYHRPLPIRLVGSVPGEFASLQAAYNQAATGTTVSINALAKKIVENLMLDRDVTVRFTGGYDSAFLTAKDCTELNGKLTVRKGRLVVKGLAVK